MGIGRNLNRLVLRLPGYGALAQRVLRGSSEVSLGEARFLGELVQRTPPSTIIEIGTLFGASTLVMTMFKSRTSKLITVDSFRWNPYGLTRAQHRNVTRYRLRQALDEFGVELIEMDKGEFYRQYSGDSPGLVFLDANHSFSSTLDDIKWAQKVGASIICGHDYSTRHSGVIQAVDECGGPSELVEALFVLRRSGEG